MSEPPRLSPLFTWRTAVTESDLPPTVRHVALTLSLYMSEKGGRAFPGPARLADDTGRDISTVKRALRELVSSGYLHIVSQGGMKGEKRMANTYAAVIPNPGQETPGSGDTGVQESSRPGAGDTHQDDKKASTKRQRGRKSTDDPMSDTQAAARAIADRNAARERGDACPSCEGSGMRWSYDEDAYEPCTCMAETRTA